MGKPIPNGIESFWALLKRDDYGTYHHMKDELEALTTLCE